jgi:hypothetical protein
MMALSNDPTAQSDNVDDWPSACCERQISAKQATTAFQAIFKVRSACRALKGQTMDKSTGRTATRFRTPEYLFKITEDKLASPHRCGPRPCRGAERIVFQDCLK